MRFRLRAQHFDKSQKRIGKFFRKLCFKAKCQTLTPQIRNTHSRVQLITHFDHNRITLFQQEKKRRQREI